MNLPSTPRGRFPRKKFISPSASAPYRSPLMHSLPEKRVQSSCKNISDELKTPKIAINEKSDSIKEKINPVQQKFVSPVATSSPFRSPLSSSFPLERKTPLSSKNISLDELKSSTLQLWEKNNALKEKIQHLEQKGLKEEEVKWYIEKLHRYNEIKDIGQTVMERLAILEQKTIKEVHEDFGMTEDD